MKIFWYSNSTLKYLKETYKEHSLHVLPFVKKKKKKKKKIKIFKKIYDKRKDIVKLAS